MNYKAVKLLKKGVWNEYYLPIGDLPLYIDRLKELLNNMAYIRMFAYTRDGAWICTFRNWQQDWLKYFPAYDRNDRVWLQPGTYRVCRVCKGSVAINNNRLCQQCYTILDNYIADPFYIHSDDSLMDMTVYINRNIREEIKCTFIPIQTYARKNRKIYRDAVYVCWLIYDAMYTICELAGVQRPPIELVRIIAIDAISGLDATCLDECLHECLYGAQRDANMRDLYDDRLFFACVNYDRSELILNNMVIVIA